MSDSQPSVSLILGDRRGKVETSSVKEKASPVRRGRAVNRAQGPSSSPRRNSRGPSSSLKKKKRTADQASLRDRTSTKARPSPDTDLRSELKRVGVIADPNTEAPALVDLLLDRIADYPTTDGVDGLLRYVKVALHGFHLLEQGIAAGDEDDHQGLVSRALGIIPRLPHWTNLVTKSEDLDTIGSYLETLLAHEYITLDHIQRCVEVVEDCLTDYIGNEKQTFGVQLALRLARAVITRKHHLEVEEYAKPLQVISKVVTRVIPVCKVPSLKMMRFVEHGDNDDGQHAIVRRLVAEVVKAFAACPAVTKLFDARDTLFKVFAESSQRFIDSAGVCGRIAVQTCAAILDADYIEPSVVFSTRMLSSLVNGVYSRVLYASASDPDSERMHSLESMGAWCTRVRRQHDDVIKQQLRQKTIPVAQKVEVTLAVLTATPSTKDKSALHTQCYDILITAMQPPRTPPGLRELCALICRQTISDDKPMFTLPPLEFFHRAKYEWDRSFGRVKTPTSVVVEVDHNDGGIALYYVEPWILDHFDVQETVVNEQHGTKVARVDLHYRSFELLAFYFYRGKLWDEVLQIVLKEGRVDELLQYVQVRTVAKDATPYAHKSLGHFYRELIIAAVDWHASRPPQVNLDKLQSGIDVSSPQYYIHLRAILNGIHNARNSLDEKQREALATALDKRRSAVWEGMTVQFRHHRERDFPPSKE